MGAQGHGKGLRERYEVELRVYVDAGYLLAAAAAARITGPSLRSGIAVDYPSLLQGLISEAELYRCRGQAGSADRDVLFGRVKRRNQLSSASRCQARFTPLGLGVWIQHGSDRNVATAPNQVGQRGRVDRGPRRPAPYLTP